MKTPDENEFRDRARAIKAFRLARVLRLTDVPTEAFRDADVEFRQYVAAKADVNEPSDTSWQMACDLLVQMRVHDDTDG